MRGIAIGILEFRIRVWRRVGKMLAFVSDRAQMLTTIAAGRMLRLNLRLKAMRRRV